MFNAVIKTIFLNKLKNYEGWTWTHSAPPPWNERWRRIAPAPLHLNPTPIWSYWTHHVVDPEQALPRQLLRLSLSLSCYYYYCYYYSLRVRSMIGARRNASDKRPHAKSKIIGWLSERVRHWSVNYISFYGVRTGHGIVISSSVWRVFKNSKSQRTILIYSVLIEYCWFAQFSVDLCVATPSPPLSPHPIISQSVSQVGARQLITLAHSKGR